MSMLGYGSSLSERYVLIGLFSSYENLNLDIKSSKKAAEILFELRKTGKIIEEFDCAIAWIYLSNNINKVITKNVKHFENILGLKIISY